LDLFLLPLGRPRRRRCCCCCWSVLFELSVVVVTTFCLVFFFSFVLLLVLLLDGVYRLVGSDTRRGKDRLPFADILSVAEDGIFNVSYTPHC